MAKNKNGKGKKGNQAIQRLQAQVADLKSKAGGQKASGKNRKKRNRRKSGQAAIARFGQNFALRSDYARAVLDPFNVRGARVPDSFMLRTGTSFANFYFNSKKPAFNFTNIEQYVYLNTAPTSVQALKPFVCAGTAPASSGAQPGSFFNIGASNTFNTGTWFSVTPTTVYDSEFPVTDSYRVTGGGLKINLTGGTEDVPILVYVVPCFNGDPTLTTYQDVVGMHTRAYTVEKNKETITLPIPIRSTSSAYNWIASAAHPGTDVDDYPDEDGPFTAANMRNAYVATVSTDNTTTNSAVKAWSLQSGLGGLQVVMKLPPGAAWSAEYIIHFEYIASLGNTLGKGTFGDDSFKVCLSNQAEIEAVGNACAAATQSLHESHSGNESVVNDLQNLRAEVVGQTAQGIQDAMQDTQILRELVGVGVLGLAGGYRFINRRQLAMGGRG